MSAQKAKLLQMRKGQAESLREMLNSLSTDNHGLKTRNSQLTEEKERLLAEEQALDARLRGILKEKELLFSRLMDVQRVVSQGGK